jgi:hypothetical protein
VLFPRTWSKFHDMIEENKVYLFIGRADRRRGDWQIICENVTSEFGDFSAETTATFAVDEHTPHWLNGSAASPAHGIDADVNGAAPALPEPPDYPDWTPTDDDNPASMLPPDMELPDDLFGNTLVKTPVRTLTVRFQRGANEIRRFKRVENCIRGAFGTDAVELILVEKDGTESPYEFSWTTHITDKLIDDLRSISGVEVFA